jgi:hypothetical protein
VRWTLTVVQVDGKVRAALGDRQVARVVVVPPKLEHLSPPADGAPDQLQLGPVAGVAVDPGHGDDLDRGRDRAGVAQLADQGGPDAGRGAGRGVLAQHDGDVQAGRVVDDLVLRTSSSSDNGARSRNGCTATSPPPAAGRVMTSSLRPSTLARRA